MKTNLSLVLLHPRHNLRILLRMHANNAGGDLVVDDCFVVFANDVDAEFLQPFTRR